MASVEENLQHWTAYGWEQAGDEWSETWGTSENLWWSVVYPRIRHFLPTTSAVEIAPGFGRMTQFLKDYCEQLTLVDLVPRCIAACQERFSASTHITYLVGDGKTLPGIPDESLDFAFSFDSLVHCERDVLQSYVLELKYKLAPGGKAFLHHSNLGAFKDLDSGKLSIANPHWRAESMSAGAMREMCALEGLDCVAQELINWGGEALHDCLSLIVKPASGERCRELYLRENPHFMDEAVRARGLLELYCEAGSRPAGF